MKKVVLLVIAGFVFSISGFAQAGGQSALKANGGAKAGNSSLFATSNCFATYNFGAGQTLFNFCITQNGNLVQLTSPAGFEHIREGGFDEGYGICDFSTSTPTEYHDYADGGDTGNWIAPIITQPNGPNTFPLTIKRTTSDGLFTLTQVFSRNTAERIVSIRMSLVNHAAVSKFVYLNRWADIDANNANGGNFQNWFDQGADSGWGYNPFEYGVMLYTGTPAVGHFVGTTLNIVPSVCNPTFPATPFFGDGGVYLNHYTTMKAGQTLSAVVEYKRF